MYDSMPISAVEQCFSPSLHHYRPFVLWTIGHITTMNLAESHLDVPHKQRWELLKPTILNIYSEQRDTIAQLAKR